MLQYLDVRSNGMNGECVTFLNDSSNECHGSRVLVDIRDNAVDRKTQSILRSKRNRLIFDPEKIHAAQLSLYVSPEMQIKRIEEEVWNQKIPVGVHDSINGKNLVKYCPYSGGIVTGP